MQRLALSSSHMEVGDQQQGSKSAAPQQPEEGGASKEGAELTGETVQEQPQQPAPPPPQWMHSHWHSVHTSNQGLQSF